MQILTQLKEQLCYIALDFDSELRFAQDGVFKGKVFATHLTKTPDGIHASVVNLAGAIIADHDTGRHLPR